MLPIALLLVFSSSCLIKSFDILDNDQWGDIDPMGVYRVPRDPKEDAERIAPLFPSGSKPAETCATAHESETPFVAVILYREYGRLLCLGAIIDERHILSAKRCYERIENKEVMALLGYTKAYWGKWSQVRKVQKIVRHEYDVAILRLTDSIVFTDNVQPSRLPTFGMGGFKFTDVYGDIVQVVGFMVDKFDVPGDFVDKKLRYAIKTDSMVGGDECNANFSKISLDTAKVVCSLGNATYCWGGLGGPVIKHMTEANPYWLLLGVVVNENCTINSVSPNVIGRSDAYGEWILGNTFHEHHPY